MGARKKRAPGAQQALSLGRREPAALLEALELLREQELGAGEALVGLGPEAHAGDEVGEAAVAVDAGPLANGLVCGTEKEVVVRLGHHRPGRRGGVSAGAQSSAGRGRRHSQVRALDGGALEHVGHGLEHALRGGLEREHLRARAGGVGRRGPGWTRAARTGCSRRNSLSATSSLE